MSIYQEVVCAITFLVVIALVIHPIKIRPPKALISPLRLQKYKDPHITIGLAIAPLIGVILLLIIKGNRL